jgi:hypothetical protein
LLKRLLPIGLIGFATFSIVTDLAFGGENIGIEELAGNVIETVYNIGLQILLWVTVGFVIAERTSGPAGPGKPAGLWTIDDLPEPPARRQITVGETALEIIALLAAGVLTVIQHTRGFGFFAASVADEDTRRLPLFNPDLTPAWAIPFFGLLVLSLVVAIARFRRGAWTLRIVLATVIDALLWIVFVSYLAASESIFNVDLMRRIDTNEDTWAAGGQANLAVAAVVIGTTLWSVWEAWKGHREYQQQRLTLS